MALNNFKHMKFLFVLYLFVHSFYSNAQFYVGESREFVKSVLIESDVTFTEDVITDSISRISWLVEDQFQMIFVLNLDDIVTRQTLIPEGKNGVNEMVKWFNEDFVIVSETEWRNYENGKIFKIELEYILNEPFFSITLSEESK